jgi:hypothetical protein
MSAEDEQDFTRLAKMTTRVAEPYLLARDLEIPEIVRRRLFDTVGAPGEVRTTAHAYARWVQEHREQLLVWFPLDRAQETFAATYPSTPRCCPPHGAVGVRAQVADAPLVPSDARDLAPARAVGGGRRARRSADRAGDGAARRPVLPGVGARPARRGAPEATILADVAGGEAHAARLDAELPDTLRRLRRPAGARRERRQRPGVQQRARPRPARDERSAARVGAPRALAWKTLADEANSLGLDEEGRRQLAEQQKRAERDLQEAVWRAYHRLAFLGASGDVNEEDLGLLGSSAAESMVALVQARLRQRDELTEGLAPSKVIQSWPKGLEEWSTKAFRDAVYASPAFPRVTRADALKDTIARGVRDELFGYAIMFGYAIRHGAASRCGSSSATSSTRRTSTSSTRSFSSGEPAQGTLADTRHSRTGACPRDADGDRLAGGRCGRRTQAGSALHREEGHGDPLAGTCAVAEVADLLHEGAVTVGLRRWARAARRVRGPASGWYVRRARRRDQAAPPRARKN